MSHRETVRETRQKTLALCDELQKRLDPLGRAGELLSAFADPDKLAALAEEFGLEV